MDKNIFAKKIVSDLAEIQAKNQTEIMKLAAAITKKPSAHQSAQDSDSETENIRQLVPPPL